MKKKLLLLVLPIVSLYGMDQEGRLVTYLKMTHQVKDDQRSSGHKCLDAQVDSNYVLLPYLIECKGDEDYTFGQCFRLFVISQAFYDANQENAIFKGVTNNMKMVSQEKKLFLNRSFLCSSIVFLVLDRAFSKKIFFNGPRTVCVVVSDSQDGPRWLDTQVISFSKGNIHPTHGYRIDVHSIDQLTQVYNALQVVCQAKSEREIYEFSPNDIKTLEGITVQERIQDNGNRGASQQSAAVTAEVLDQQEGGLFRFFSVLGSIFAWPFQKIWGIFSDLFFGE